MIRTSRMTTFEFALVCLPVRGGKGDNEIKQQEQQQQSFNAQLQNAFTQQFGAQSSILNTLNQRMTAQLNNPTGFTPAQMAALNTNNTEGAAKAYAAAQTATQEGQAARGGSSLPSGVSAQLQAENANAGAAQEAQGSNAIQLANAQQQQNNYWQAASALGGVAQQENPNQYASSFNQGSGTVGSLGQAYNQTQQSQLMSTLGGLAGAGVTAFGNYEANK